MLKFDIIALYFNFERSLIKLNGLSTNSKEMLITMFTTEQEFLTSEFGKSCLFFHAWNMLSFLPKLIAFIIVFWQLIGWTGMNDVNLKKGKDIKGFLYSLVITFFLTFLTIGAIFMPLVDVSVYAISITGVVGWFSNLWLLGCYFFIILALAMYVNWFFFFKNLILKLYHKFS